MSDLRLTDLRLSDLIDTVAKWDRAQNSFVENLMLAPMSARVSNLLYGQVVLDPLRPRSMLGGMSIYYSDYVGTHKRVQVRFPKSKKKRIVMKWFKDPKNWESWFEPGTYILNGRDVMIHPSLAPALEKAVGR